MFMSPLKNLACNRLNPMAISIIKGYGYNADEINNMNLLRT